MINKLWGHDGFAAVIYLALGLLLACVMMPEAAQTLDRKVYDLGVRQRDRLPSDQIAIVAIDDASRALSEAGSWTHAAQAQLIATLQTAGAHIIGDIQSYAGVEYNAGGARLRTAVNALAESPLTQQIPVEIDQFGIELDALADRQPALSGLAKAYRESALARDYRSLMTALLRRLNGLAEELTTADAQLGLAMQTQAQVVLAIHAGSATDTVSATIPAYAARVTLPAPHDVDLPSVASLSWPTDILGTAAAAVGLSANVTDADGVLRSEALLTRYQDRLIPSLTLSLALQALQRVPSKLELGPGDELRLEQLRWPVDADGKAYPHFYRRNVGSADVPVFPVISAADVLTERAAIGALSGQIVLIGSVGGETPRIATPLGKSMTDVELLAHQLSSLMQQDGYARPSWSTGVIGALVLLIGLYLGVALHRLRLPMALLITGGLATAGIAAEFVLLTTQALWLPLALPSLLLIGGHIMIALKHRLMGPTAAPPMADGRDNHRLMGLAYQGQGLLDQAFERFTRIEPADESTADLIYNLALDGERQQRPELAERCFRHLASAHPGFRDVARRLDRDRQLSETLILGEAQAAPSPPSSEDISTATNAQRQLGRYLIDRELGKGAMGLVYLGHDPTLGRAVAIKTLALSREFDASDLASVKERFFREATTAGRLSHPHIVSIYDAGEQDELAYIAMEFVAGHDLKRHTKSDQLLPISTTLKIAADAADALDYAHRNGVIHRDVKPANMMLADGSGTMKLMDFGIARITDSSKTRTGIVLGTPSYMSPEQLGAKKLDGRSDLFSLGVTLYQLLTGSLPFRGDSIGTLMLKIATEAHTPASVIRPDLPAGVDPILDRVLSKAVDARFTDGAEMAQALRAVLQTLRGH